MRKTDRRRRVWLIRELFVRLELCQSEKQAATTVALEAKRHLLATEEMISAYLCTIKMCATEADLIVDLDIDGKKHSKEALRRIVIAAAQNAGSNGIARRFLTPITSTTGKRIIKELIADGTLIRRGAVNSNLILSPTKDVSNESR